ncbi:hypothetical protein PMAYCL1PPCAC_17578, partial [Pristionchus mayeri]
SPLLPSHPSPFIPISRSSLDRAMARNDRELEDLAWYKTGVFLEKWKILELLDEGGFGKVYRVQDTSASPPLFAALKIESTNMEGGSAIKLERAALERIHKNTRKEHVPQLYRSSKRGNICYMIVTLLGDNLKKMKERYYPNGYPLRLWVKVAVQSLFAIKTVHDAGFVHRDVKAANFVFGHPGEAKRARIIHIIDFGLARQYVVEDPKKKNQLRPRPARPKTDFRGTWSFASPSMHDYVELGRKDDVWSWLFMLMDLYATLPWANLDSLEAIGKMKQAMRDEDLVIKMPPELLFVPRHLRKLDVYNRPDYRAIYDCLHKIFTRCRASWYESYPWENRDMASKNLAAMSAVSGESYLDPGPFFQSDPIKINVGPSKYMPADDFLMRPSMARSGMATVPHEPPPSGGSAEKMLGSAEILPLSISKENFAP